MSEPTETTRPETPPALAKAEPDFAALFQQASAGLAQKATVVREVEAALAEASPELAPGLKLGTASKVKQALLERAELGRKVEALVRDRAHLAQELEGARLKVSKVVIAETIATRARRLFLEALRGQPYERDVRDLLERAEAKAADQAASA